MFFDLRGIGGELVGRIALEEWGTEVELLPPDAEPRVGDVKATVSITVDDLHAHLRQIHTEWFGPAVARELFREAVRRSVRALPPREPEAFALLSQFADQIRKAGFQLAPATVAVLVADHALACASLKGESCDCNRPLRIFTSSPR